MTSKLQLLIGGTTSRQPLRVVVALVTLIGTSAGCSTASIPTSPFVTGPGPLGIYTLSGVVVAPTPSGLVPVEGARVEMGGLRAYVGGFPLFAMTDATGFFSISMLSAATTSVWVFKRGYETGTWNVTIDGDTRLDFQLLAIRTYTLFGIVSEITPTGLAPVEGVEVYCDSCGEFGHTFTYTDAKGAYSFSGVYGGLTPLLIRKTGFQVVDPARTLPDGTGTRNATVNGDTRFDIELVRR